MPAVQDPVLETSLCESLITAYWLRSTTAETAALDQIHAHLAGDHTTRATRLAEISVLFSATMMRAWARSGGHVPSKWVVDRIDGHPRADADAYEVACECLEDELNTPGSGLRVIGAWMEHVSIEDALALVREALWIAAEIGWQTV